MKISTAKEMAIATPDAYSLEAIKEAIPNPGEFPLPTPDEVLSDFTDWYDRRGLDIPKSTFQFLTGHKEKGKGESISSYPTLYRNAIVPLQVLWAKKDQPQEMIKYLIDNPIRYKKDKDPEAARNEDGSINEQEWVARCLTNLMEWLYLPSNPVYQYLREHLLEKARKIRTIYKELDWNNKYYVQVLPQRPTTSRSLGADETPLNTVNAGYRIIETDNPYLKTKEKVLELITWFYTNAHTEVKVYSDYVDIENDDIPKAIRKMRRSPLYYQWARNSSPAEYDKYCANYRLDGAVESEITDGLTYLY